MNRLNSAIKAHTQTHQSCGLHWISRKATPP